MPNYERRAQAYADGYFCKQAAKPYKEVGKKVFNAAKNLVAKTAPKVVPKKSTLVSSGLPKALPKKSAPLTNSLEAQQATQALRQPRSTTSLQDVEDLSSFATKTPNIPGGEQFSLMDKLKAGIDSSKAAIKETGADAKAVWEAGKGAAKEEPESAKQLLKALGVGTAAGGTLLTANAYEDKIKSDSDKEIAESNKANDKRLAGISDKRTKRKKEDKSLVDKALDAKAREDAPNVSSDKNMPAASEGEYTPEQLADSENIMAPTSKVEKEEKAPSKAPPSAPAPKQDFMDEYGGALGTGFAAGAGGSGLYDVLAGHGVNTGRALGMGAVGAGVNYAAQKYRPEIQAVLKKWGIGGAKE